MEDGSWIMYVSVLILIGFSAYFSASETAFSSVNKIRLKNYADSGSTKAKAALEIAENYDRTLSTILVGNNVVNIASASIATILFTDLFGASGAAISTAVTTVLVLIFGEILPKSYAKENSEKFALKTANILNFVMLILSPVAKFFTMLQGLMARFYSSDEKNPSVTEEELKYIIETIEEEGVLKGEEADLVQSALDFNDITVQEILTHRVDMVALDITDDMSEIIATVMEERFTRLPVYEKSVDNIIGILQSRDLLEAVVRGETIDLRGMLSEPHFVHKTKKISTLLADFKRMRSHIAIVTDDYGGTMGIVTMEDVLEQLVGDIWDEDEEVEQEYTRLDDETYEVSGDMDIEDMFELFHYDDRNFDSEYNTMSGWAMEQLERLPAVGDSFTYHGFTITVLELEEQRVKKLRVHFEPEQPEQDEEEE